MTKIYLPVHSWSQNALKTELKCTNLCLQKNHSRATTPLLYCVSFYTAAEGTFGSFRTLGFRTNSVRSRALSFAAKMKSFSVNPPTGRKATVRNDDRPQCSLLTLLRKKFLSIHIHHFGDKAPFLKHAFLLLSKKQDLELISRHPTILKIKLVS